MQQGAGVCNVGVRTLVVPVIRVSPSRGLRFGCGALGQFGGVSSWERLAGMERWAGEGAGAPRGADETCLIVTAMGCSLSEFRTGTDGLTVEGRRRSLGCLFALTDHAGPCLAPEPHAAEVGILCGSWWCPSWERWRPRRQGMWGGVNRPFRVVRGRCRG